MTVAQFLQSDKTLTELTRMQLYDLLSDKAIMTWLHNAITSELIRRIS